MIYLNTTTDSTTQPAPSPVAPVPSTEQTSSIPYTTFALIALFVMIASYLIVKWIINFKRSIDKTKSTLKHELVTRYVQGFNWKSSAILNIIIINVLSITVVLFGIIYLAKKYEKPLSSAALSGFYGSIAIGLLLLIIFWISYIILFINGFKDAQYHHKKDLEAELKAIKNSLNINNYDHPELIKLDIEKIKAENPLGTKVIAKFIYQYNHLQEQKLEKQYLTYLDQIFKINLFLESLEAMEKSEKQNIEKIENQENETKEVVEQKSDTELTKLEKEIIWMERADRKVTIIKEANKLEKSLSKEEIQKRYEEYLYTIRNEDPLHANVQRNSWLTYRDSDIEDLFYNPNSYVIYSIDNGQTSLELSYKNFIIYYKDLLIKKFYSTK
ncbi:Uncharacterised protein [Metamycoplasma cloacale]|uniref:Uncharacterized protein n=1 Tax=Metamycoplasma cloacale TaxID=92401 RepID=A0A2Z4LLX2_9BACT|nr:hypothetical protein [Metamycoplasma cloacale]AWX42772.1 hypothetical protein DK849_01690 [Metamycoplasma cloacale]VEU79413.1 Uncharacterised protein [Metamycoplasma cloacale]